MAWRNRIFHLPAKGLTRAVSRTHFEAHRRITGGSLLTIVLGSIVACGGGGNGGEAPPVTVVTPPTVDPLAAQEPVSLESAASFYGIDPGGLGGDGGSSGDGGAAGGAGDGSPIAKAVVKLTDAQGNTVEGLTDANGKFLLRFNTSLFKAPYVLRVVDAGGNVRTSVITETISSGRAMWANINPMTDKVVSDVLDSSVGGTDKTFDGSKINVAQVAGGKANLATSVRSALSVAGITDSSKFDPIRSLYRYDGAGVDAVLDSLNHTRDAGSGVTQLRTKLQAVVNDANGTEVPVLVTSTTPLAGGSVALASGPTLTFDKLSAWMREYNRCLTLSRVDFAADVNCIDADGSRLVRTDYRSSSKDFREDFRSLFSEDDGSAVQNSSIRNANILFVGQSPGSTVNDLAVVEFTIQQPYIGPKGPDGPVQGAIEYPKVAVFKQDNSLTRAKAGNWILYGNQQAYNFQVEPRYYRFNQGNPSTAATFPSYLHSSIRMFAANTRYDAVTKAYVNANLRVVRVKGPGLPTNGIVLARSTACGAIGQLALLNKTGNIPATAITSPIVQNDFRLASVTLDGKRFTTPGNYFPQRDNVTNAIPYLTDFSPIRAYSLYRFEVWLQTNLTNTPDSVEDVRILAPLMAPEQALNLPMNDVTPSMSVVAEGAPAVPAGNSIQARWTNNSTAAPIRFASLYTEERTGVPAAPFKFYSITAPVPAAYSVGAVPTTQAITVPSSVADPNCSAGRIPAFDNVTGAYRELTLTAFQGRARVLNSLGWNR